MPGDKSEKQQNKSWLGKKKVLIIPLIILIVLAIGGAAFSFNYLPSTVKKLPFLKALATSKDSKEEAIQTVENGRNRKYDG